MMLMSRVNGIGSMGMEMENAGEIGKHAEKINAEKYREIRGRIRALIAEGVSQYGIEHAVVSVYFMGYFDGADSTEFEGAVIKAEG